MILIDLSFRVGFDGSHASKQSQGKGRTTPSSKDNNCQVQGRKQP